MPLTRSGPVFHSVRSTPLECYRAGRETAFPAKRPSWHCPIPAASSGRGAPKSALWLCRAPSPRRSWGACGGSQSFLWIRRTTPPVPHRYTAAMPAFPVRRNRFRSAYDPPRDELRRPESARRLSQGHHRPECPGVLAPARFWPRCSSRSSKTMPEGVFAVFIHLAPLGQRVAPVPTP